MNCFLAFLKHIHSEYGGGQEVRHLPLNDLMSVSVTHAWWDRKKIRGLTKEWPAIDFSLSIQQL